MILRLCDPRDSHPRSKRHGGPQDRGLGKTNSAIVEALGASPVSLNLVELSPALQQGVIDGLNAPIDIILAYKWNETAKHVDLCVSLHVLLSVDGQFGVVGQLDPELRGIIQKTADEVALNHRTRSEQETEKAIQGLRDSGVDVHVQTPEERAAWIEATAGVWDAFAPQVGTDLTERVRGYGRD